VDGIPIPRVEYTEKERETWASVLRTMRVLHPVVGGGMENMHSTDGR
jgi:hypothetical protein